MSTAEASDGQSKQSILLLLLPFWTPLIPPMGIASLKSYLQAFGYRVRTADANVDKEYKVIYDRYFNTIEEFVPQDKRGNYLSIGADVLRNHLMAHMHQNDTREYNDLVKILVNKTYFVKPNDGQVEAMNSVVADFYEWEIQYLERFFAEEIPDVLGITATKDTIPATMFAFRYVREKYPQVKNIMGGPVFSEQLAQGCPDLEYVERVTKPYIDKFIIGNGEFLFLRCLERSLPEDQRIYSSKDEAAVGGKTFDYLSIDVPDYSDFTLSSYPYMGAEGSTGCHFDCSFCNVPVFFGKFKLKDISQTAEHMIELYRRHGTQLFYMADHMINTFVDDLAAEFVKRDASIYYSAYMRVDNHGCNKETALFWRRGGLYRARLGVDSGSEHVLQLMDKQNTPDRSKAMLSSLAYAGIQTTTYWLIGHPGETEEDFQATLDLLEECKNDIWEAECEYLNYYYTGQSHSDKWGSKRELVYPASAKKMLIIDKWGVGGVPSREEIFSRVRRFVRRCRELGIPNPYTMSEIKAADERWQRLHQNSVPPIMEFINRPSNIQENKHFSSHVRAKSKRRDDGDFAFGKAKMYEEEKSIYS